MSNLFIKNKELFGTLFLTTFLVIIFIILNKKNIKNKYNCGYNLDILNNHLSNIDTFLKNEFKSKITSRINDMNVLIKKLINTNTKSQEVYSSFDRLKTLYTDNQYNQLFERITGINAHILGFELIKEVNNIYKGSDNYNVGTYNYINKLTSEKSLKCNIIHSYSKNVALLFKEWVKSWPQEDYKSTVSNIEKLKKEKVLTDKEKEILNSWDYKTIVGGLTVAALLAALVYYGHRHVAGRLDVNAKADGGTPAATQQDVNQEIEENTQKIANQSPPGDPSETRKIDEAQRKADTAEAKVQKIESKIATATPVDKLLENGTIVAVPDEKSTSTQNKYEEWSDTQYSNYMYPTPTGVYPESIVKASKLGLVNLQGNPSPQEVIKMIEHNTDKLSDDNPLKNWSVDKLLPWYNDYSDTDTKLTALKVADASKDPDVWAAALNIPVKATGNLDDEQKKAVREQESRESAKYYGKSETIPFPNTDKLAAAAKAQAAAAEARGEANNDPGDQVLQEKAIVAEREALSAEQRATESSNKGIEDKGVIGATVGLLTSFFKRGEDKGEVKPFEQTLGEELADAAAMGGGGIKLKKRRYKRKSKKRKSVQRLVL